MGSSVEVYDPRIGSWMMVEPMNVSRKAFGSFVLEGKIYIVGGMQDNQVLDLVRDDLKLNLSFKLQHVDFHLD